MSSWAIVFAVMSALQGVGDNHRGQWLPFWQRACREERRHACPYFENLVSSYCDRGSGWACNEFGRLQARRELDRGDAVEAMIRGCELGFSPSCVNADRMMTRGVGALESVPPALDDYPIVLRGSKGPVTARAPAALYALACREGWSDACGQTEGAVAR
jgi:hypothetical protein